MTIEPAFVLESFLVNPINYLIKPIEKIKLFETLALAISKVNMDEEHIVSLRTRDGLRVVKLSSIIFCGYRNHSVQYKLMSQEMLITKSIQESFSQHIKPYSGVAFGGFP